MTLRLPGGSVVLQRDDEGYFRCSCNQPRLCIHKFKQSEKLQAHIDKNPKLIWIGSSVCKDFFLTIQTEFIDLL